MDSGRSGRERAKKIVGGWSSRLSRLAGFGFAVALCAGCGTAAVKAPSAATAQASVLTVTEFIIGPGDKIDIVVFRNEDLKRSTAVDLSGKISFPLIGDVQAGGKSVFTLQSEMEEKLSRYLVKPQVFINVTAVLSRKTMVLGEVRSPGYFVLDAPLSVLDVLAKAGGTTDDANLKKVLLIRKVGGAKTEVLLNVDSALKGGDFSADLTLQSGDIIYVPSKWIAGLSQYMAYIRNILSPIIQLEGGIVLWPLVKDTLQGKDRDSNVTIPTAP